LYKRNIYADEPVIYSNKSIDWQMLGYVTPAKESQGKCGSCTAYAIVGALEAQYFKQTQVLKSFSEQFLVDCNLLTPNVCHNGASLVDRMCKE
jgi:C1A family cysteine protease